MLRLRKVLLGMLFLTLFTSFAMAQDVETGKKGTKPEKKISKTIRLRPTALSPDATGIIRIDFSTPKEGDPKQSFELIGVNLNKNNSYKLFIDGNEITARDAKVGKGETEAVIIVEFSSKMKEGNKNGGITGGLPTQINPVTNIKHVEIRDANNQIVLVGDFVE
jgi:hypothetical protein